MTIYYIPPEKHEGIVKDIQWTIRNMYKDFGFTKTDEQRQQLRNQALDHIEAYIAEHEDFSRHG